MIQPGPAPFSVGAHVVMLSSAGYRDARTIGGFWRSVERYKATLFSSVPTVLSALLNVPREGVDVRLVALRRPAGAAPLSINELFQPLRGGHRAPVATEG